MIDKFNEYLNNRNYTVVSKVDLNTIAKKIATELGYTRIKYIASGSYGDTWKVTNGNDTKVLKITTDANEAKLAEKLRTKGHFNHIIDYFDVRRVYTRKFKRFDNYSIIMEYVTPLDKHRDYNLIHDIIQFQGDAMEEFGVNYIDTDYIKGELINCGHKINDSFFYWINQLKETFDSLKKIGIPVNDADIHPGNFGYRKEDDNLIFFDISTFDFSWLKLKQITIK